MLLLPDYYVDTITVMCFKIKRLLFDFTSLPGITFTIIRIL